MAKEENAPAPTTRRTGRGCSVGKPGFPFIADVAPEHHGSGDHREASDISPFVAEQLDRHYRLERRNGYWRVMALRGAESAADGRALSLCGCSSLRMALRLWLALVASGGRR